MPASRASTINLSSGSVPEGRIRIRPASPSSASTSPRALRRRSSPRQSKPLATRTLIRVCGNRLSSAVSSASVAARAADRAQHLQRADRAVAGAVAVQAQQVARALAAEQPAALAAASRARSGRRPWRARIRTPLAANACSSARLVISVPTTPGHRRFVEPIANDHVEQLVAVVGAPLGVDDRPARSASPSTAMPRSARCSSTALRSVCGCVAPHFQR